MIPLPTPLFDTLENYAPEKSENQHPYPQDYHHAAAFIYSYRGSHATFNAYRREIERLLQWSNHVAQKPLTAFKRQDIEQFIEFCQQPPEKWIANKKTPRFIDKDGQRQANPQWRPFVASISKKARNSGQTPSIRSYTMSQGAIQAIFSALSSFFNYLMQEDYMELNPVSQIRQKSRYLRKQQHQTPIRRLSELQWAYVIETAEMMAHENAQHERTLFIMNALYGMYLRISELAATTRWQPQMNDFFRDPDNNWWFRTVGKGNKERQITVSDSMLNALKRYRSSLNLSPLPDPSDTQALIIKNKGKGAITSTRHIRQIVQDCFDQAVTRMENDQLGDDAEELKSATVHWLRHTGISDDVKTRPREHVRDDAGHGSSAITDRYIDIELRERHRSGKSKTIKPADLLKE